MQPSGTRPKVSVCVITYNQEDYIRECLRSIVDQKTSFEFEALVSDDSSSDGTSAIVREFAERYPARVRAVLQTTRIGGTKNYLATHALARGDYIAHIDGDDQMLPGKLQLQAQYLDDNPQVVAVWHRMRTIEAGRISEPIPSSEVECVSRGNVLRRGFAGHHSSLMYRRDKKPALEHFEEVLDFTISTELLGSGKGVILPDVLGIYRKGVGAQTTHRRRHASLVKDALEHYLIKYPQHCADINRLAFSLFAQALLTDPSTANLFLRVFLDSLNARTPWSIACESALLTGKLMRRLRRS